MNRSDGEMVRVLDSSVVDRRIELWSGYPKGYEIGMRCFSAKHAALRRKSKNWLARDQNKVFEWTDMFARGLLFQWASTIKSSACCSWTKRTSSLLLKFNLYSLWYCWKLLNLVCTKTNLYSSGCYVLCIYTRTDIERGHLSLPRPRWSVSIPLKAPHPNKIASTNEGWQHSNLVNACI